MIRLLRFTFWSVLFLAATFAWVVFFAHGVSGFAEGAKAEFQGLRAVFDGG